jgi:O-acetyl-ADP-ribose deacetylase (regulator of RNase III)
MPSTLVTLNHLKNNNLVIATHKCNGAPADYILQVAEDTYNYLCSQYPQNKNQRLLLLALSDDPRDPTTNHFFLVESSNPSMSIAELKMLSNSIELGSLWDILQINHENWDIIDYDPYSNVNFFEAPLDTDLQLSTEMYHHVFQIYLADLTADNITFFDLQIQPADPPISFVIGDIGHIADLLQNHTLGNSIAVVNAANAQLATGGGVTGALVRGVGGSANWNQLMQKAQYLTGSKPNLKKGLKTGEAVWTSTAGQLLQDNVKTIIHTLGPVAGYEDINLVSDCILNVLKLADHLQIQTLILPAISGGIFASGHPTWPTQIRQLILKDIQTYLKTTPETSIKNVYLISYDQADRDLWPVNADFTID